MATEQGHLPDAYDDVLEQFERVTYLQDGGSYLNWDQEVMMPDDGTPARAKQLSTISGVRHDLLTDDVVADGLAELDESSLPQPQAAEVREVRRQYERAARVPRDLVERISEETSNALPVWKEAKAESDWSTFAPKVETLLDLKREYAEHIDPDADPYAVLFADYEPYLDLSVAEDVLTTLRDELVPLIDEIKTSDTELADPFGGTYSDDTQMELCRSLLDTLGYDWDRGRIDVAPHPFSLGTQFDARVTTRFDEGDPVGAIGSTIHEFGHATYTLGLPQEHYGSPLGQHRGLTVHESQSRLMENHVGRSRAFWGLVTDEVNEHLGTDITPQEGYEAANQIYPENRIRVEADELTYHMHIVLRFEIERDLVAGDLDVEEVPAVWNEKMEEYLGVTPENDAEGCLQDIHWSHGSFGYFSTYSLGSVLAAQLFAAAEADIPDLDGKIRAGEFDPVHDWLTENVHGHGQRYETNDLVREATGSGFSAEPFVEYATAKFGDLYDL
jgi:carboxypeptidase Taq